ncbi:MAG: lysine biosynthesis protein LysW [Thaumarchaeota archaeon]|nr:lysine biosynthesis protein LysW [Nitrososphaerota archaeon]MBI3116811.1 lysine biosynthesis protein LysW [Nitrososphaerota archaeon]
MEENCEECDARITIPQDALVGEIIKCKECGSEYEVASIRANGVKLKSAEVAEEDWGE